MRVNRIFIQLFFVLSLLLGLYACTEVKPSASSFSLPEDNFNFIVGCDFGRNGYYDQKAIAAAMGEIAEEVDVEFVVAGGDVHHYMGIESVSDPLWMTNFELIYSHPELQIPWFPVLGNHEYQGNTQAVIDYTNVSRRWNMPNRYYSHSFEIKEGTSVLLVHVDTPSLIDKYRKDSLEYPDAGKQDMQKQLAWIDSTLNQSADTWKIVVGHHPIYAETSKTESERTDLQKRLDPVLRKNNVDIYVCGHIHNFQHIKREGSNVNYVVNTSASLSRKVSPIEGTVFCNPETGFSIISVGEKELKLYMLNKDKEVLHTVEVFK